MAIGARVRGMCAFGPGQVIYLNLAAPLWPAETKGKTEDQKLIDVRPLMRRQLNAVLGVGGAMSASLLPDNTLHGVFGTVSKDL